MTFELGLVELLGFAASLVAGGWALLKISLNQFERRLDERFKVLDSAVADVKRLELEIVRSDARNAQIFITKADHDKILERIFNILERMDKKLDLKADAADCEAKILRHVGR